MLQQLTFNEDDGKDTEKTIKIGDWFRPFGEHVDFSVEEIFESGDIVGMAWIGMSCHLAEWHELAYPQNLKNGKIKKCPSMPN